MSKTFYGKTKSLADLLGALQEIGLSGNIDLSACKVEIFNVGQQDIPNHELLLALVYEGKNAVLIPIRRDTDEATDNVIKTLEKNGIKLPYGYVYTLNM